MIDCDERFYRRLPSCSLTLEYWLFDGQHFLTFGARWIVARVDLEKLRPLAAHVLYKLSTGNNDDKYEHVDPVAEYDKHHLKAEPT